MRREREGPLTFLYSIFNLANNSDASTYRLTTSPCNIANQQFRGEEFANPLENCWIMTNEFGGNDCLHYLVA